MPGLIERWRDRLPFGPDDPVVSLSEGSTPLVLAERVSERAGCEVWLKLEGANPTGSFKDRGMTCAVSAAARQLRRGADARARARPAAPDRAGELGQPVPARGPEDRLDGDRRGARPDRRASDPRRQRRQHHGLLEGLSG